MLLLATPGGDLGGVAEALIVILVFAPVCAASAIAFAALVVGVLRRCETPEKGDEKADAEELLSPFGAAVSILRIAAWTVVFSTLLGVVMTPWFDLQWAWHGLWAGPAGIFAGTVLILVWRNMVRLWRACGRLPTPGAEALRSLMAALPLGLVLGTAGYLVLSSFGWSTPQEMLLVPEWAAVISSATGACFLVVLWIRLGWRRASAQG